MLVVGQRLVAEEQHAVAEQGAMDGVDVGVRRRAQVDAVDDRAERRRERVDVDGRASFAPFAGTACAETICWSSSTARQTASTLFSRFAS